MTDVIYAIAKHHESIDTHTESKTFPNFWIKSGSFYDTRMDDAGAAKLEINPLTWTGDGWPQAGAPITY